jgi:hypothetical protein
MRDDNGNILKISFIDASFASLWFKKKSSFTVFK